jgi:uncharacterized CHY-type Zn-finger protein
MKKLVAYYAGMQCHSKLETFTSYSNSKGNSNTERVIRTIKE